METSSTRLYTPLRDKTIILGVTGSSALYRSVDLARELIRRGASVHVIMTKDATTFVSPKLFEWATGNKAITSFDGEPIHIVFAEKADSMVIAPATLNTMSKIAYGIGDNPLVLTAIAMIGSGKSVAVVPAMNIRLYNSPETRKAIELLKEIGVIIIPPHLSEGKAKYPPLRDLTTIVDCITCRKRDMEGRKVLVTAGPTRERIDPVRVITNPSSGLMGVLVALEFYARGADVTLVHGPLKIDPPYCTKNISVESTNDMAEAVERLTAKTVYDVAVFAAAPADYTVLEPAREKIPSRQGELALRLAPTRKVIGSVKNRPRIMIGFAAETAGSREELVDKARKKLFEYRLDLIVANIVGVKGRGFEAEYIDACLVEPRRTECLGFVDKAYLARKIVDWTVDRIGG